MTDTPDTRVAAELELPPVAQRLKQLRAVLFDLDGTLIDTVELIRVSFRYATEKVLGEALPDEVTMENVGQPLYQQFKDMAPGHEDELLHVYREFNRAHHDEIADIYPGTLETVEGLADAGMPMGVVTSKGWVTAKHGLDHFGLTPYMEVIVSADDVPIHKPDPFPLRFAAEKLAVPLEYCIYLGDSPHDMQAAISGNAISVAALWGAFTPEEVLAPGPQFALPAIERLPDLLNGSAARYAVGERTGR